MHYLQHVEFEGPGCIQTWAQAAGIRFSGSRVYQPHRLPSVEDLDWLLIMGGPMNIYEDRQYPWLAEEKSFIAKAIEHQKVVIGICLGAQLIAAVLGARISSNRTREIGWYPVYRTAASMQPPQLSALQDKAEVLHWHGDTFDLPRGAVHLARSVACENQAFVYDQRVLGLQFHLEMTPEGLQALAENCANGVAPGPFVQSPSAMLADPQRFERANRMMSRLLEQLLGRIHS